MGRAGRGAENWAVGRVLNSLGISMVQLCVTPVSFTGTVLGWGLCTPGAGIRYQNSGIRTLGKCVHAHVGTLAHACVYMVVHS